jgi:very-short-patch-repair endonuclease
LVVKIDGPVHERRRAADARRDRVLARAGYAVLRFTTEEVMHELASVVERIQAEVARRCR